MTIMPFIIVLDATSPPLSLAMRTWSALRMGASGAGGSTGRHRRRDDLGQDAFDAFVLRGDDGLDGFGHLVSVSDVFYTCYFEFRLDSAALRVASSYPDNFRRM